MEFAKSLSGHDRNQFYLVVNKDDKCVYLVNGETKKLDHPKKKNKKHVQIVKKLPREVVELLEQEQTDSTIKKAIKTYVCMLNTQCES